MGGGSGARKRSVRGRREMASRSRLAKMPSGGEGGAEPDRKEKKKEKLLDRFFYQCFPILPILEDLGRLLELIFLLPLFLVIGKF